MSVTQISVFTQSKPGHLLRVLKTISDSGASVRGYSVSDTGDYGVARFIVDKPSDAIDALTDAGFACNNNEVICIELDDKPGQLSRILTYIAESDMNISYSYSLISTYIAIGCSDVEELEKTLASRSVKILNQLDLI